MKRNPVARALRSRHLAGRRIAPKTRYTRKAKHKNQEK